MVRPRGVRARLLVVVLVAVVPVVVLLVVQAAGERDRAAEDAREESLRVARLLADRQTGLADELGALLGSMTATARGQGFETACDALSGVLAAQRSYDDLALLRRADGARCGGDFFFSTSVAPGSVRRRYVAAPAPSLVVVAGGAEVLAAGRSRVGFGQAPEQSALPRGSTFLAFDDAGRIYARRPNDERFVGSQLPDAPLVRAVAHHGVGGGTFEAEGLDGVRRLYGHGPVAGSDLHIVVGTPTSAAYADADADLRRALLFVGATALLAVAFTLVLAEVIVARPSYAEREALLRELVGAHDEERKRLAEDIHDETIQALTAAGLRVQRLRRQAGEGETAAMAREAEDAVGRAIAELRGLMVALLAEDVSDGLAPLLRRVLDEELAGHAVPWDLDVDLPAEPSPEVGTFVARNVREAVRNVAKHAGRSRVDVRVRAMGDGIEAVVHDDGVGFERTSAVAEGHVGLRTMRQRTERVGGWLDVRSAPGEGTTVRFGVPVR